MGVNSVWYPTFMQMPGGMFIVWQWIKPRRLSLGCRKSKFRIDGEERLKYPIPGKEGEYFTSRLDVENAKNFHGNIHLKLH